MPKLQALSPHPVLKPKKVAADGNAQKLTGESRRELIAVISAAIAETIGTDAAWLRIKSIKKSVEPHRFLRSIMFGANKTGCITLMHYTCRYSKGALNTMHKFIVNVNGTSYEVEVEEIDSAAAGETASAPKKAAPKAAQLNGSEKTITAPMPGSILAVNVKPGDSFRSGQVLLILEAMKMENEIMAPCDGKVVSVSVQSGTSVNSGDVLIAYV